jgi:hypothetical protein
MLTNLTLKTIPECPVLRPSEHEFKDFNGYVHGLQPIYG